MKITGEWIDAKATQRIFTVLETADYQVLFVGGCVRNALLEEPVSDIDIATDAPPEAVAALAEAARLQVIPTGIAHGTVTIISGGAPYEVTTFRKDVETFGRHAVVSFSTEVEEDARRRDFTMNAIYARSDGTIVDPLNGMADLKARRVRFVGDATQRIREDYLRILRFFRFQAWYGNADNGLDAEGLTAAAENADGLQGLSRERVGSEIVKLLAATDPAPVVAVMRSTGILQTVLPGADDRSLASLIHFEDEIGASPNAIRRLAALGGQTALDLLRLSNVQARRLELVRDLATGLMQAAELGYRHGVDVGGDALLVRAALLEQPLDPAMQGDLELGASQKFPVSAHDLMPELSGPELGAHLKELEMRWIASDFSLSREQLLG